ncbi:transcription initiation factor TFIID subunit 1 isoform X1 [Amborella trichopoda]|nr:transcription initiation factor TFIID subunit 1 isoform X1 [Amborella trichopoda]|eukprot:XP_011622516.1 transcription initiation factor TFIID subunit 1 isoform X1 [Amborella trichopoda]
MEEEEAGRVSPEYNDEEDEEDYEDDDSGNRLLGFMFGNVDDSGDLDVDYLDEDAKEHLSALADKLGSSLTEIDLSVRKTTTPSDGLDQDYYEKAEDAVDYEDIDEQYEGPEIQAASEEDLVLPKKEYFSANVSLSSISEEAPIFGEENYDEDDVPDKESNVVNNCLQIQAKYEVPEDILQSNVGDTCPQNQSDFELVENISQPDTVDNCLQNQTNLEVAEKILQPNGLDYCLHQTKLEATEYVLQPIVVDNCLGTQTTFAATENILHSSVMNSSLQTETNFETGEKNLQVQAECPTDEHAQSFEKREKSPDYDVPFLESDEYCYDADDFLEVEPAALDNQVNDDTKAPLPILCREDGMVVLRFSEIFGRNEPFKKNEKRPPRRHSIPKDRHNVLDAADIAEEDEEAFLKGTYQGRSFGKVHNITEEDSVMLRDVDDVDLVSATSSSTSESKQKDSCHCVCDEQTLDMVEVQFPAQLSPMCSNLYLQQWEDEILWGSSPPPNQVSLKDAISRLDVEPCDNDESEDAELWKGELGELYEKEHSRFQQDKDKKDEICAISRLDTEPFDGNESDDGELRKGGLRGFQTELHEKDHSRLHREEDEIDNSLFLQRFPVIVEPFDSNSTVDLMNFPCSERDFHPQILRLESSKKWDALQCSDRQRPNGTDDAWRGDIMKLLSKLSLQNNDLLEGSWLDRILWEPSDSVPNSKLILNLQDEQMLFEILDNKESENLYSHAGAMIITHSVKSNSGEVFEASGQGASSVSKFNLSNDKYYSNRKTSPQSKSHAKKRAVHGVKVLHSIPALKLQTMKPKLSNKDIANFHRPKALWYPHDNEVAAKEQGKLSAQGPMKIILKSMGGKGSKLHVDAAETVASVKGKASKKLDFKSSEKVKVFYSGKELEDDKSLAQQNVRPNSVLHLVRTMIHLWPKAQRLPGEDKPLRPPGAFKKKSELSVKVGHVFLMEYCEERPLLLGNVGMGARLCTYYQKSSSGDQTATTLRNGNNALGSVLALEPMDKSPFLGDIKPSCSQQCLETNMFRAPVFPHKLSSTDYLLVRSAKGRLSLRRIDRLHVVGQQEPHMEVISPGSKGLQSYLGNRLLVYLYREFRANEKPGFLPYVRADELSAQFPNLSEPFLRKRLKHCADLQRGPNGETLWMMRRNFRIPTEEELRRMMTPENVCAYESMQVGLYRLKRLGISKLTHPNGLSSAMNQLPDEAIALAAASHIERELQVTSWNLSSNFVSCTMQDRENIERLEITGVGDPSGRGLGFSYVRVAPKAPISSNVVKKKVTVARGGSTVTGTDADLRRLSMEAAREVLLKFKVPEEQIEKMTRWHRIAMVRKLSSEQAASGVKVDAATLNKFARGQRMSFLQLQQQTREKCQEIWDRQVQSLSQVEGEEPESDSEANSDLDSFAGDLENLLDAEECEEGDTGSKKNKFESVKGLGMRRRPSQAHAEEEIEDEAAEAAELCRMLMDDDEVGWRKKKKTKVAGKDETALGIMDSTVGYVAGNGDHFKKAKKVVKRIIRTPQPDGTFTSKEVVINDPKEVEKLLAKKILPGKGIMGNEKNEGARTILPPKKSKIIGDGVKVFKEKKQNEKPVRESFVCGACGELGHMRTNKRCPMYKEEQEIHIQQPVPEIKPRLATSFDAPNPSPHPKLAMKKKPPKSSVTMAPIQITQTQIQQSEPRIGEQLSVISPAKSLPLKFKCVSSSDMAIEKSILLSQISDAETGKKDQTKINKIKLPIKMKPDDLQPDTPKTSASTPTSVAGDQRPKKIIIKQPKVHPNGDTIKRLVDIAREEDLRKTQRMVEDSRMEKQRLESKRLAAAARERVREDWRLWEEEEKRRALERAKEDGRRQRMEGERLRAEKRLQEEQQRVADQLRRYSETKHVGRIDGRGDRQKVKKKKKKKKEKVKDEFGEDYRGKRNDRRIPERDRAAKRRPVLDAGRYASEHGPQTKRRRGGEVVLSNILEGVVERLRERYDISYLFLKPVSKKDAPDYLDIIDNPMDLSTIREKVRKMEYKTREDFRHDVWQIAYNAHKYNDGRNPGIPPLADQLLEICDYLLDDEDVALTEAESGIELRDH